MLEERCFRAAAAEAKQGSGRDWSPRAEHHRPVRPAPSSAGQRSACRFPDVWPGGCWDRPRSSCLRPLGRSELFALALALALAVAGCRAPRRSCFRPLGPSERVALAISGRGRGLPGALGEPLSCSPLPLLSSPSERGEVQNDLVRAASLHPLSSGL
eukprot:tig00021494_g21933.t1